MQGRVWALAAATALVVAAPVAAAPPSPANGTLSFTTASNVINHVADGNTFIAQTNEGVLTGTFSGTFVSHILVIRHADGTFEAHGTRVCACTVDGLSGTVAFRVIARGVFGVSYEGQFTVLDATGDLAGLQGEAKFAGPVVGVGTYTGKVH